MEHAMLSASGSHRWMHCTPSARLEQKYKETQKVEKTSVYAEEGTLAHEFGELFLKHESGEIDTKIFIKETNKLKKNKLFSDEMLEYVQIYADHVMETYNAAIAKVPDSVLMIEEILDFSHIVPEGFGTGDTVIISDNVLDVMDLKYGRGVKVSAEENSQMMLYGLGALNAYDILFDIDIIRLTVIQPRLDNIDTWRISKDDLIKWGNKLKATAQQAFEGKGVQKAGDWCKFCNVKGMCATLASVNIKLAQHEFKSPHFLTDEQLINIFKQIPMLVDWASGVNKHMLDLALAGKKWPGLKMVEGRSNRSWKDEIEVAKILVDNKYTADKFMKSKLEGVAAIQKLLKDNFNTLLGAQVIKPTGAPALVSVADKRLEFNSPELDFKEA